MGFSSGAITFRRFFLVGQRSKGLAEKTLKLLPSGAFGEFHALGNDGMQMGWIKPTHFFDTDFSSLDGVNVGRFLYVAMRVDRTSAPATIVRSYRLMEEAAIQKKKGATFLSRKDRKEAREAAQARAEKEAKGGAFRRTSAVPVVFDLEDGVVYFGNAGASMADRLVALCAQTLDLSLVPATVEETAGRLARRSSLSSALDDMRAWRLVDAPSAGDDFDGEAEEISDAFLGREFLTYLWWLMDTEEGLAPAADGKAIEFAIHQSMQLECVFEQSGKTTVRTDAPAVCPESRSALLIGKQPVKAGLMFALHGDEITLTLDAQRWCVTGLRLPRSEERDPSAALEERLMRLRNTATALDDLLAGFLTRRCGRDAAKLEASIQSWIARMSKGVVLATASAPTSKAAAHESGPSKARSTAQAAYSRIDRNGKTVNQLRLSS